MQNSRVTEILLHVRKHSWSEKESDVAAGGKTEEKNNRQWREFIRGRNLAVTFCSILISSNIHRPVLRTTERRGGVCFLWRMKTWGDGLRSSLRLHLLSFSSWEVQLNIRSAPSDCFVKLLKLIWGLFLQNTIICLSYSISTSAAAGAERRHCSPYRLFSLYAQAPQSSIWLQLLFEGSILL